MQKVPPSEYPSVIPFSLKLLSGRWKLIILWCLSRSGAKFSELKTELGTISSSVLSAQLKELQKDTLIEKRHGFNQHLAYYSLTTLGKALMPLFEAIDNWEKSSTLLPPDPALKIRWVNEYNRV